MEKILRWVDKRLENWYGSWTGPEADLDDKEEHRGGNALEKDKIKDEIKDENEEYRV